VTEPEDVGADGEIISAEWLRDVGFKWHQTELQPDKHWLLWLGSAVRAHDDSLMSYEDLGIELAPGMDLAGAPRWFCWLRSDAAGRYHRFIHLRYLRTRGDVRAMVALLSGQAWDVRNHWYGSCVSPAQAEHSRREHARIDRRFREERATWSEAEKDPTRGGALPEHLEAHIKAQEGDGAELEDARRPAAPEMKKAVAPESDGVTGEP
jgi:hypothetical protein